MQYSIVPSPPAPLQAKPCPHRLPTVIAHRGLSSIFPQNTLQSIISGFHSADFSQIDIHLTKDDEIVVFHDRTLKRVTNIQQLPQFAHKYMQLDIDDDHKNKSDWWLRQFTLRQLQKLRVRQPIIYRPQLQNINFRICSFEELLEQALKIKNKQIFKNKLKSGILVELKEQIAGSVTERDRKLCKKLVEILNKYNLNSQENCLQNNLPIILQSFNIQLLSYISQLSISNPLVQLYDKNILITQQLLLRNKTQQTIGIGITSQNLLDLQNKVSQKLGQLCMKMGYALYYWTVRDDDMNSIPFGCRNYQQVYAKLRELGVTGIITEFPEKCRGFLGIQGVMFAKGNLETDIKSMKDVNKEVLKAKVEETVSDCESNSNSNSNSQSHSERNYFLSSSCNQDTI